MSTARALLLLPSGHRAYDADVPVGIPVPPTLTLRDDIYYLWHLHHGVCDAETRALYVLGGVYQPHGYGTLRYAPDEAFTQ